MKSKNLIFSKGGTLSSIYFDESVSFERKGHEVWTQLTPLNRPLNGLLGLCFSTSDNCLLGVQFYQSHLCMPPALVQHSEYFRDGDSMEIEMGGSLDEGLIWFKFPKDYYSRPFKFQNISTNPPTSGYASITYKDNFVTELELVNFRFRTIGSTGRPAQG